MDEPLRPEARVLFVKTPRYLWPFNSEASAFWPPLGFCALAAALRSRYPELRVSILDCPALKVGWRSLERILRERPPDVLCIGEEAVSSPEGLRLAALARSLEPAPVVVAGGVCFSYMVEETLAGGNVDFVVRGEGEATLVDLMRALLHGRPVDGIAGLAWQGGTRVRVNPLRPPIVCPDDLPRPAYDLLQLGAYGRGSRNHPRPATLEHGRGCIDRCSFCILWKHFGAPRNGSVVPCYRTKSPERAAAEVEWLARDHGRRTIHFVDPTFNVSSQWSDRFADLVLAAGLDVQFTAWMRADGILRDEENGVLEKLVRAGLVQVYVGVERDDDRELARLNKHNNGPDVTRKAFEVLRTRYPGVFTIGTIIYGMPWESEATLRRLRDFHLQCPMDYAFHIPLAPNPGTDIRDDLLARGYALSDDLRDYNFLTPVADTDHLTRRELEQFYSRLLFHLSPAKLSSLAAKWHPRRSARVRRVQRDLLVHGLEVGARQLARCLLGAPDGQPTLYARKPRWYDS